MKTNDNKKPIELIELMGDCSNCIRSNICAHLKKESNEEFKFRCPIVWIKKKKQPKMREIEK